MGLILSGEGDAGNAEAMQWGKTQSTDYSTAPQSYGVPDNFVDPVRSSGVTWTGFLGGLEATANTLANTFSKVYQLNSSVENAKFQRTVQSANLDLQRASTLGSLEVQKARVDATNKIELARAGRAIADAQTQQNGGVAGFVSAMKNTPAQAGINPLLILGILGAGIAFMLLKASK